MTASEQQLAPEVLRDICGRWATGVAIVTGTDTDGTPLGLAVNSFTSLSLDPPLILFCPAHSSSTWPRIRKTSQFAVNVLSDRQAHLVRAFARSGGDKFAGVEVVPTPDGLPAFAGAAARLVCRVDDIHPGGDHEIVVGRVLRTEQSDAEPLLFHRGMTKALSMVSVSR
ncbi:flavin reductase family protein [Nocardia jiangxiensis]|uniref:Flavin reductase family protein n=1 Tax=Nocardia jiangxiensis TaxID=282685 RepID=A0ABW6S0R5_9NOCA